MGILDFKDDESLGKIIAVDTATVTAHSLTLVAMRWMRMHGLS